MAKDLKYGKVLLEHSNIGDDEPIFVIRARDAHALEAIGMYRRICASNGAHEDHLASVDRTSAAVRAWQIDHAGEVKAPDSPPHREEHVNG